VTPKIQLPIPVRGARTARRFSDEEREFARFARALAHPARVAILRMLIERGECVCGGIVDRLPLAQATVSQHLKVLKESGLVQGEVEGPRVCYCVEPIALRRFQTLAAQWLTERPAHRPKRKEQTS
jgi:ArsR family transcriptional regulator, arsenate/arsenite/antimonite-responsive transcriptional repressor